MRLDRFSNFILNNNLIPINESIIQYSDKFRELLKLINSNISNQLLSVYKEDREVKSNWLDIGKDSDHLSFLVDAKAKRMDSENKKVRVINTAVYVGYYYNDFFEEIGHNRSKLYIPDTYDIGEVKNEKERLGVSICLVFFDEEGDKQCVIKKDNLEKYDGVFWEKNRQDIRIGRAIRSILTSLNISFNDAEIEEFVNKYKALYDIVKDAYRNFDLVRGNKIAEFYQEDNYYEADRGELGNSCMKKKPSWYFGIYTQNSAVCSLLILKSTEDSSKIVGRALVWNLTEPDITFMDRIYTNIPSQVILFREYAKSKGWHYKKENNSSSSSITIGPDGKINIFDSLKVRIKSLSYSGYPYVDTLKYLSERDNFYLSTSEDYADKTLESTSGSWEGGECECCGGSGSEGCGMCDGNGTIQCEECTRGTVTCQICDGEGTVESSCVKCDGTGELECEECGGDGDCDECGSTGMLTCDRCEGDGKKDEDCDECNGDGEVTCGECSGDGEYECQECGGEGQVSCSCCN